MCILIDIVILFWLPNKNDEVLCFTVYLLAILAQLYIHPSYFTGNMAENC